MVRFSGEANHFRPAYCIAVQEATQQILVVVRGTGTLSDSITSLAGQCSGLQLLSPGQKAQPQRKLHAGASTSFQGGQAHEGMLRAAQWLIERELDSLASLLQQHAGFQMRFIGHSLGAGTATLATMLLQVCWSGLLHGPD